MIEIYRYDSNRPDRKDEVFCDPAPSLAMAYVPMQKWEELYDPDVALKRGTLFRALDLPFLGEEALPRG